MIADLIRSGGTPKRLSTAGIPWEPAHSQSYGPGIANQPSHETLLRETIGIMASCVRAISNRFATLEFAVYRKQRPGPDRPPLVRDDLHPLKGVLDNPHPDYCRFQFLQQSATLLCTVGEVYYQKVFNPGRMFLKELHIARPGKIRPLTENNVVVAWEVLDGHGRRMVYPKDDFVRIFFMDPENPWGSEGIVGPAAIELDSMKFSHQHLRAKYQYDATPSTVIEATEHAEQWSPETQARFYERWRQSYQTRTGERVGLPAILPTGYKIVELAMQSGKDITPLLEYLRDDLLMAAGVPRSILGQVLSGDRSSAETNAFVFDLHTVKPYAELHAGCTTLQLARPLYGPDIVVGFEEFVSEDKVHRLAQEQSDLDRMVRSINEIRVGHNHEPAPWGDEPVGNQGQVPYDPDEARERMKAMTEKADEEPGRPAGDEEDPMSPEEADRAEREAHIAIRKKYRKRRRIA